MTTIGRLYDEHGPIHTAEELHEIAQTFGMDDGEYIVGMRRLLAAKTFKTPVSSDSLLNLTLEERSQALTEVCLKAAVHWGWVEADGDVHLGESEMPPKVNNSARTVNETSLQEGAGKSDMARRERMNKLDQAFGDGLHKAVLAEAKTLEAHGRSSPITYSVEVEDVGFTFGGTLMEGPDIDLVMLSGLNLSDDEIDRLWEETNPRDLLVEVDGVVEIEVADVDDSPGLSDTYFEYQCGDKDDFIRLLRKAIIDRIG